MALLSLLLFLSYALSSSSSPLHKNPTIHLTHNNTLIATPRIDAKTCNIFDGSWMRDESLYPLYHSCPFIDPEFNCQLRPDIDYLRFKWKPTACDLPRFNGLVFLERMRGKTLMFVGDSLGRNQWESLICMLMAVVHRSSTRYTSGDPLSTFKFLDYDMSVSFFRAPYLVDIETVRGKRILRLDRISTNAIPWKGAHVLFFNSGHWWTHTGHLQGWDYMRDERGVHEDMDRLVAFQKGLLTWAKWVDTFVDRSTTRVFIQSISPTHYNPMEWSDRVSKNCYGQTTPVAGLNYKGVYPYQYQMRVLEGVVKAMTTPAYLLDITTLSELRKDGHPSVYGGNLSPTQRSNPTRSADCSHWCLPGLPDTWNQLLYAALFF